MAIAKRLDRLSRQFDRLERDQSILIETVSLYVRYFLTVSLPVPEGRQEAARAQGRPRYVQFVEQLARQRQRGRSLVREIHQEIFRTSGRLPTSASVLETSLPHSAKETAHEASRRPARWGSCR